MIIRQTVFAIALAVFILAVAAGLRYAEGTGMVGADAARRTMQVLIGLSLAAYANIMPKQLGRLSRSPHAESRALAALRVGGWSMTLAGLAYAGLWALAPMTVANPASMAVVAGAMAITIGYSLWSFTACRDAGDASAG